MPFVSVMRIMRERIYNLGTGYRALVGGKECWDMIWSSGKG